MGRRRLCAVVVPLTLVACAAAREQPLIDRAGWVVQTGIYSRTAKTPRNESSFSGLDPREMARIPCCSSFTVIKTTSGMEAKPSSGPAARE